MPAPSGKSVAKAPRREELPRSAADELQRAGEAIELERLRLEVLIQQLPVAVLTVDARSGEIVLANQHACDLFLGGRGPEGTRLVDLPLLHAEGPPVAVVEGPITRALRDGVVTTAERYGYRRADNALLTLEVTAAPLRSRTGEVVTGIVVAQDVTEREARERAEREFLSNAAHQLRTPVAAIQSAIDVLEAGAKVDLLARDRFLGHIARAAKRLGQLSQSLLILARAQAGERPRTEAVEVAPLLREVAAVVRPAPGVDLAVRCRRDLVVLANRDLLREALASLVENAVRYTREGHISLRGRRNGDKKVVVEVADTGTGMTAETQARMFERFYGGEVAGSFGLGLAIAAQAAAAMGVEIDVDSAVGRGTAVRLTLPAGMLRTK